MTVTNNPAPVEQRHRDAWEVYGPRIFYEEISGPEALARFERDHCTRADALRKALSAIARLPATVEHGSLAVELMLFARDTALAALTDAPQAAPDETGRVKVEIKKALHGIWPIGPDDVDDCANIAAKAALAAIKDHP